MKLLVKTTRDQGEAAREWVASSLTLLLSADRMRDFSVSRVFPSRDTGSRSRIVSVELPDDTPATALDMLLGKLEEDPGVEYVHLPERKKFLAPAH